MKPHVMGRKKARRFQQGQSADGSEGWDGYTTGIKGILRRACARKAKDALVANKLLNMYSRMNLRPGGKQPEMHDTMWGESRRKEAKQVP